MLDAAVKALSQMFSPPFRTVLLKSVGLALVLLIVLGIVLYQLLAWLIVVNGGTIEGVIGHTAVAALAWILAIVTGFGLAAGGVFLMPAVTALVASFFVDEIAALVEHTYYPADPPGAVLPLARAVWEGLKTALIAVLVYLCAVPFLLVAGLGAVIFFLATAWLLGREYFELAAMRFNSVAEAKHLRKLHRSTVFLGGLFIALFVSIPIVNLATPLFATAFMVHVHKRIVGRQGALVAQQP
jgi:uncharacterized protein involved in cysteine biosynthesis